MTFEEFVSARLAALLRHATVVAGDPDVAADVVQEVLVRAHPRWSRISGMGAPEAYVRRMIINELVSVRRRVTARRQRELRQPPAPAGDWADRIVQHDALVRQIRALPTRQRIAIALRYFEDLADGEIAELMGCSVGTVRSHVSRALAALRVVASAEPAKEER